MSIQSNSAKEKADLFSLSLFFFSFCCIQGADLSHVICAEDAATAIKSYSPDLIVHPLIRTRTIEQLELTATDDKSRAAVKGVVDKIHAKVKDEITGILERVHVLVIGPGLSRDATMQQTAKQAIQKARSLDMPVVIDAVKRIILER